MVKEGLENEVESKVYCPCCGKSIVEYLDGEYRNPCPRCNARLRVVVSGVEYTISGIKPNKNWRK